MHNNLQCVKIWEYIVLDEKDGACLNMRTLAVIKLVVTEVFTRTISLLSIFTTGLEASI